MAITLNTKVCNFRGVAQPGNLSTYANQTSSTPSGFSQLTAHVQGTPGGNGNYRTSWKLKLPITVPEDSTCGCAGDVKGVFTVDVIVSSPQMATLAERTDVRTRIQDLVLTPEFIASIQSLDPPLS